MRSSSVSQPGNERHRVTGHSISTSGERGGRGLLDDDGIDLCNPKRSELYDDDDDVGSSSGSLLDRRREGEQGTDIVEGEES